MTDRDTCSSVRRLAVALAGALAAASAAHAGSIPVDSVVASSQLIVGNQTASSVGYSLTGINGPGVLHVTLSDDQWPTPLSDFSFTALNGTNQMFTLDGSGSYTYDIAGAGSYFGYVTGMASGPLDLGLYSLNITFDPAQPVPLPASVWMLLAGLAAAAGALRYRSALPYARLPYAARLQRPVPSPASSEVVELPVLAR
jgi:hypothetical protein